jgi:hypothetical protein
MERRLLMEKMVRRRRRTEVLPKIGVGCGESLILVCEEWKNKAGEKGGAMMGARQKKSQDIFYVKELV